MKRLSFVTDSAKDQLKRFQGLKKGDANYMTQGLYKYVFFTFHYSRNLLQTFDQEKNSAWPEPRNTIKRSLSELKYCLWKIYEHASREPGTMVTKKYIKRRMKR